jgi:hypothetical protein
MEMSLSRMRASLSASSRAMTLLRTFVPLGAFLGTLGAFGAGPNDWTDSRYYVECGQDCLYNKANENVTLQAMYLVKKMQNLGQVLEKEEDANHVISELKLYCPEVKDDSKDIKDATKCYQRYVQTQLPILRAMKATLVRNEDMSVRLNSNVGGMSGASQKSSAFADQTPGSRKPQTSDFQKERDLLLSSKNVGDRLAYLSKESYVQWANDMESLAPKESDFQKTEKVVIKDPRALGGAREENRIMRSPAGQPIIDERAYQMAKLEYDQHINGKVQSSDLDLRKVAKGYEKKTVMEIDPNVKAQLNALKPGTKNFGTSRVDDVSYSETRNEILGEKIKNAARGVYNQDYPSTATKADRKTASAAPDDGTSSAKSVSKIDQLHKEVEKIGYDQVTQPVADATPTFATHSKVSDSLHLNAESLENAIQEFQKEVDILK